MIEWFNGLSEGWQIAIFGAGVAVALTVIGWLSGLFKWLYKKWDVSKTQKTLQQKGSGNKAAAIDDCENTANIAGRGIHTGSEKYVSASLRGKVTFDYSNNNGSYIIGAGDLAFETHWSKASDISIHTYNDSPSIAGIGLALDVKEISEITDATRYDMSSRDRTPREGEIVVARNQNGYYAALKVLDVKDRTRADDKDELTFEYVILSNRTADFTQLD